MDVFHHAPLIHGIKKVKCAKSFLWCHRFCTPLLHSLCRKLIMENLPHWEYNLQGSTKKSKYNISSEWKFLATCFTHYRNLHSQTLLHWNIDPLHKIQVTNCKHRNFHATLIFALFAHQEACANPSTRKIMLIYIVVVTRKMPYAKATTHVYVKMVAKREHLHMRKYPRLQYLLQGKPSLREDIEVFPRSHSNRLSSLPGFNFIPIFFV